MSLLSKSIARYVDELLAGQQEIVHGDAADTFIAKHGDVIGFHVEDLVRREIVSAIKERSQVPAPPLGQGLLFTGLPAAVTVRDGVTKPIKLCTRTDLAAGRDVKVDNIAAAQAALVAYDDDCDVLLSFMHNDDTTVADIIHFIAESA